MADGDANGDGREGDDLDWFGRPMRSQGSAPCPRCDEEFRASAALAAHLREIHGVEPGGRHATARSNRRRRDPGLEAGPLGRNPTTRRQRTLRTVPLWLVLMVNVATVAVALVALDGWDPPWWQALTEEPWWRFVLLPTLWPTVAFLALRE
jgi:hypothetical protein